MTTPKPLPYTDLTRERHLLLPNRYRIGDSVAVMTLRAWVEKNYGPKDWYLAHPNTTLATLSRFTGRDWQWYGPHHVVDEKGARRAHIVDFDDVNLWLWNDYFHWEGFRLDLTVQPFPPLKRRILFAPLLEVDYAPERRMHIRFVRDLCAALKGDGLTVLSPQSFNMIDRKIIESTGVEIIGASDLETLVAMIGSADVFIGGDTGASHIAGMIPHVGQVALHDRLNTERHNEREFDHQSSSRERIRQYLVTCPDDGPLYKSTPNKADVRTILFDHCGCDGRTLNATVAAVGGLLDRTVTSMPIPTFDAPTYSMGVE